MESVKIKEKIDLNGLLKILGEEQKRISELNNELKKFCFNWENATEEYVEISTETELYEWLYNLKFNSKMAFILEMLEENMERILINRVQAFRLICTRFNINLESFHKAIKDIQELLIEFNKVKICKDGKVILMNE